MPATPSIACVPISDWATLHGQLFIVAGPCSVESRQQLLETARGVAATGSVSVLRAGVWKPRSRPGQFEGKGSEALPWLQEAREETGLPVAIEVARPGHAEMALRHSIDMVWLGARTTVNPFMVEEIAQALCGTGIPVMIKNPVSPDFQLWVGAIERIHDAVTKKIVAVHRGFHTHTESVYRNMPYWDIPHRLKQEIPGLPVICDPSHIAGNTKWIGEVARKALALQMDGLMIESHYRPETALTDPRQQVSPKTLGHILSGTGRAMKADPVAEALRTLREQIDDADYRILGMMARRLGLCIEIGKQKKERGEGILQPSRLQDMLQDRMEKGQTLGIDTSFVHTIFRLLHDESVSLQRREERGGKRHIH